MYVGRTSSDMFDGSDPIFSPVISCWPAVESWVITWCTIFVQSRDFWKFVESPVFWLITWCLCLIGSLTMCAVHHCTTSSAAFVIFRVLDRGHFQILWWCEHVQPLVHVHKNIPWTSCMLCVLLWNNAGCSCALRARRQRMPRKEMNLMSIKQFLRITLN